MDCIELGFSPVVGREFAPLVKMGAGPPPSASVFAHTLDSNIDDLRWFHGPAGIVDLRLIFC